MLLGEESGVGVARPPGLTERPATTVPAAATEHSAPRMRRSDSELTGIPRAPAWSDSLHAPSDVLSSKCSPRGKARRGRKSDDWVTENWRSPKARFSRFCGQLSLELRTLPTFSAIPQPSDFKNRPAHMRRRQLVAGAGGLEPPSSGGRRSGPTVLDRPLSPKRHRLVWARGRTAAPSSQGPDVSRS